MEGSSAPYKDLEKNNKQKTVCEGNEKEILKEIKSIKQSLSYSSSGPVIVSSKGKFTKKQLAVGVLLGASVFLNAYLLYNMKSAPAMVSMAQGSS